MVVGDVMMIVGGGWQELAKNKDVLARIVRQYGLKQVGDVYTATTRSGKFMSRLLKLSKDAASKANDMYGVHSDVNALDAAVKI